MEINLYEEACVTRLFYSKGNWQEASFGNRFGEEETTRDNQNVAGYLEAVFFSYNQGYCLSAAMVNSLEKGIQWRVGQEKLLMTHLSLSGMVGLFPYDRLKKPCRPVLLPFSTYICIHPFSLGSLF